MPKASSMVAAKNASEITSCWTTAVEIDVTPEIRRQIDKQSVK